MVTLKVNSKLFMNTPWQKLTVVHPTWGPRSRKYSFPPLLKPRDERVSPSFNAFPPGYAWHTTMSTSQPSRSTQPSTLCGTLKWVSAFGLSNNGDGGCSHVLPTGRPMAQVRQLGPKVSCHFPYLLKTWNWVIATGYPVPKTDNAANHLLCAT